MSKDTSCVNKAARRWRRLCVVLLLALLAVGWNLAVRTCYPKEWDGVWYGMSGAEVWALCGEPDGSSGGMKPDHWKKPFLLGTWHFYVYCGDMLRNDPVPVSDITLYYEQPPFPRIYIKYSLTSQGIVDQDAYDRAFGYPHGAKL